MRKFHFILLMTLGLLLSPSLSFACGKKADGHHKETSAKSCKKECCKEKKQSSPCGENHKDCDGKCGHSSCNCPSFSAYAFATIPMIDYKPRFIENAGENVPFGYTEAFFQSAIDSLRLPPKIG
ncbi:hypothetical protein OGH69_12560 [Flavobacterium sp. MFBS3-15]|uniref:hypothetical protein n=1 Tax=Flavobacterium sp. MFBS3-15 TaxID=2989816 RepID=UPI002235A8E3|nr:hypothetical protein [Flavobacterium sp. MFBS3-15]MCW4469804.1 hypothetical protein [Flavobacterium sp. MFBS3-15]